MQVNVRPVTTEMIRVCAEMMADANSANMLSFSGEQCIGFLDQPSVRLDGAFRDRELIGFVASKAAGFMGEPLLDYVCVAESARNCGAGSALITFFEDELFPEAENLYLFVSDVNVSAKRLYGRLGYEHVPLLGESFGLDTEFLHRKTR